MSDAEEERAAAYRAQMEARAANKAALEQALSGNPVLYQATWEKWAPLLPDCDEDDPC